MLIMSVTALAACSGDKFDKFSGKYVCTTDKDYFLEFSDDSTVLISKDGEEIRCAYLYKKDTSMMLITGSNVSQGYIVDGNMITDTQTVFRKVTFFTFIEDLWEEHLKAIWEEHWLVIIIVIVILGVIGTIFEKITAK